ncbi:MAG: multicopper oxidase domain-containing protein [Saccharospirillaceae bacterium]|nr:multicopper oxidase domain-containing protein [Pseudomonadales bacterium]NRB77446.1 multicopper oxidase domain-containing protein [Saccharospirillaceae bacterium]
MNNNIPISRRSFVAIGVGVTCSNCSFNSTNKKSLNVIQANELPIPELLRGESVNGKQQYNLTMQQGSMDFVIGKKTKTLGYNGNFLGPTLLMYKGENVEINVHNELGEASTTHWHGLHLPPEMDGGPLQKIEHGQSWLASFLIKNEAATYWYHPHLLHKTGEQVYKGLAGLLIIKDTKNSVKLPEQYAVDDIPIIVQDREFDDDGSLYYSGDKLGVKAEHILVNGGIVPNFTAPAQLIRFRILNASNARIYNFGFSDQRQFHQIATDGGLLENPVVLTRLKLSPGERAEIILDLNQQENTQLSFMSFSSEMKNINPFWNKDAMDKNDFTVMTIKVVAATAQAITSLPEKLSDIHFLDETKVKETRILKMKMPMFGAMTINGESMDMDRIDIRVKLNTSEIWEIVNDTDLPHPFHIHAVQFQIIKRDGIKPAKNERGWKDVVLVAPGESVSFITHFSDYANPTIPYMYHCHILEHEDNGMMGQFVIDA